MPSTWTPIQPGRQFYQAPFYQAPGGFAQPGGLPPGSRLGSLPPESSAGIIPGAPGQGQTVTLPDGRIMVDGRIVGGTAMPRPFAQFNTGAGISPNGNQMTPVMRIIMGGSVGVPPGGPIGSRLPSGWNIGHGFSGTQPGHELPPGTEEFGPPQSIRWDQKPALPMPAMATTPATSAPPVDLSFMNPKFNLRDEYKNWGG